MGQAKQRGTFEQRKQQAIERNKKLYASQLMKISQIRKDLEEHPKNPNVVMNKHPKHTMLVAAIASAMMATTPQDNNK